MTYLELVAVALQILCETDEKRELTATESVVQEVLTQLMDKLEKAAS